jgi:hypothetical protein
LKAGAISKRSIHSGYQMASRSFQGLSPEEAARTKWLLEHHAYGLPPAELAGQAFINRNIRHAWCFEVRKGARAFESIAHVGNYGIAEADQTILRANPAEIEGKRFVVFGGGSCAKEALQIKVSRKDHFWSPEIVVFDLARQFKSTAEANLAAAGVSSNRIRFRHRDFSDFGPEGIWANDYWGKNVRAADDQTRLIITMYGNTLGNFTLPEIKSFLWHLRAKLRPGDEAWISYNGTRDHDFLLRSYGSKLFEQWFKHVTFKPMCKKLFQLRNVDWDLIDYKAGIGKEGDLEYVRGYLKVDETHPAITFGPDMAIFLEEYDGAMLERFKNAVKNFAGSEFEFLSSRLFPDELLLDLCRTHGFETAVRLAEPAPATPLRQGICRAAVLT